MRMPMEQKTWHGLAQRTTKVLELLAYMRIMLMSTSPVQ